VVVFSEEAGDSGGARVKPAGIERLEIGDSGFRPRALGELLAASRAGAARSIGIHTGMSGVGKDTLPHEFQSPGGDGFCVAISRLSMFDSTTRVAVCLVDGEATTPLYRGRLGDRDLLITPIELDGRSYKLAIHVPLVSDATQSQARFARTQAEFWQDILSLKVEGALQMRPGHVGRSCPFGPDP
jgi:hypothetical protein